MPQHNDAFNRHVSWPDAAYQVIDELGVRLLERLAAIKHAPEVIVDVGSGCGQLTQRLNAQYPKAQVYALDWAYQRSAATPTPGRWRQRIHPLAADMQQMPLADSSVDLVFSHLAAYWSQDPQVFMAECQRVLKPGGLFMFTTLGPDSYRELRQAWAVVGEQPHVNVFLDMHEWGDAMLKANFKDPVMDVERLTVTYQEIMTIMQDLHQLGETNRHPDRQRGLTGKQQWQAMLAAYERQKLSSGLYPVSLEVNYGHAWGAETPTSVQSVSSSGEVLVDINVLKQRHNPR